MTPARGSTLDQSRAVNNFWARVDATGICWEWAGALSKGYGRVTVHQKQWLTHRLSWELLVGPIPEDMTLDHLCRNRKCCNPDHLEVVTRGENSRRGPRRSWVASCRKCGRAKAPGRCVPCDRESQHRKYLRRKERGYYAAKRQQQAGINR